MTHDDYRFIAEKGFMYWSSSKHNTELSLRLKFYDKVVPKERPRTGKSGHVYTPKRTLDCEKAIASLVPDDWRPFLCPVKVTVIMYEASPKWVQALPERIVDFMSPTKGDVDNKLKTITDALNGLAYKDDAQIRKFNVERHYHDDNEYECTIEVERWGLSDHEARQIAKFL